MQVFPSNLRDLWTTWELPIMVLLSLFLQVVLIPMGHKRKYTSNNYLRWLLWLAYLSADSVAFISLGILSNGGGHSLEPRYIIRALWAPFFLLHLGGPDTITAYAMPDNDMWLRHLFDLLVQVTLSLYIFLLALQPTTMNFIAIPVFVAGIIKYAERTWVLRSASSQHLRDEDIPLKGFKLRRIGDLKFPEGIHEESSRFNDMGMLRIAHSLFKRNKWVLVDLVLSFTDLKQSLLYFVDFDFKTAFKVVELELGFLHDFFFTKASLIFHTRWGALLRLISLCSIVIAITAFCTSNTHKYPAADVYLTFILLFGSLGAEIYSIFLLLRSDLCVVWLSKIDNFLARLTLKAIYGFGWSVGKRRWLNSFPQYNLMTHCREDSSIYRERMKFLKKFYRKEILNISQPISDELKERIFKQLKEMTENEDYEDHSRELPDWILRKRTFYDHLGWSMKLDSAQSILLWHIATEVCYYSDHKNKALNSSLLKDTKLLSHYLVYLLSNRHSLFSNGMNRSRINATVIDIKNFLRKHVSLLLGGVEEAYKYILQDLKWKPPRRDVKELGINSVFNYGVFLAQELQGVEENERWEIISHEWVEMLANIACECKPYDHIEQLGHGGDFLTHVWLLMHHIGYTKRSYNVTTASDEERVRQFRILLKRWLHGSSGGVTTKPCYFSLEDFWDA